MNYIPVNRTLTVAGILLALVAAFAMSVAFAIMFFADKYHWSFFIVLPLAFVSTIGSMIILFGFAANAWMKWAYLRVTDVKELEQASQLSGFGWYSPFNLKEGRKSDLIKLRFKEYRFVDDVRIPQQTEVYFKKVYQNFSFMLSAGLAMIFVVLIATHHAYDSAVILPIVMGAIAFVIYYKSSDRSPQITLSDRGIEADGTFYDWANISRWEVRQGKTSDLSLVYAGSEKRIDVTNLAGGNRRLNHLLHVYSQRGKSGSGDRGAVHRPGVAGYRPQA